MLVSKPQTKRHPVVVTDNTPRILTEYEKILLYIRTTTHPTTRPITDAAATRRDEPDDVKKLNHKTWRIARTSTINRRWAVSQHAKTQTTPVGHKDHAWSMSERM